MGRQGSRAGILMGSQPFFCAPHCLRGTGGMMAGAGKGGEQGQALAGAGNETGEGAAGKGRVRPQGISSAAGKEARVVKAGVAKAGVVKRTTAAKAGSSVKARASGKQGSTQASKRGSAQASKQAGKQASKRSGRQDGELVLQRSRVAGAAAVTVQRRRPHRNAWTIRRRTEFLEVLQASCNVTEAARSIGMTPHRAYELRRRDPGFAAQWAEALEQGYAELEMLLLRQSIHGSETTETLDDGKGEGAPRTKTVHSFPHAIALRLLLAHRGAVDAFREERGIDRAGSETVRAEIQRRMSMMRQAGAAGNEEAGGDAVGGHDVGGADAHSASDDVASRDRRARIGAGGGAAGGHDVGGHGAGGRDVGGYGALGANAAGIGGAGADAYSVSDDAARRGMAGSGMAGSGGAGGIGAGGIGEADGAEDGGA